MLTTPADPTALVGRWIRLRDHDRPNRPILGVLTRCTPVPNHPGLWQWGLPGTWPADRTCPPKNSPVATVLMWPEPDANSPGA